MKVVFAGTPEFAARHLEALLESDHEVSAVITQPDKPGKRGKKLIPSPVKRLAEEHGLTVLQPKRFRADDIAHYSPDVLVVVAYGQILKEEVLSLPAKGCINVHASYLPRWRGAAPIQRAILAGDKSTGITIIQMDAGLDTGDMLIAEEVEISADDTAGTLADKLGRVGARLLIQTLDEIDTGNVNASPQDDNASTYANKIEKDEARVDWLLSADEIARHIRAFNPEPVAYADLGDMRVRIHKAVALDKTHERAPGTILDVTAEGVEVACGEKTLLITGLQLPVGKGSVLTGRDILNARSGLVHTGLILT